MSNDTLVQPVERRVSNDTLVERYMSNDSTSYTASSRAMYVQ